MKYHRLIFLLTIILLCFGFRAEAQGMMTELANQYKAASAGWMTAALIYAHRLFYLLITIEIVVFGLYQLFQKDSIADFFAALLIKMLAILFFWVLIQEAPVWIPTIIQSFTQAGAAIGNTTTLDPSSVVNQGLTVANTALEGINNASFFDSFLLIVVAGLSALVIVIAYTIIAAQLLMTLVESYIVIGGGALMIGFAGSRWTLVFTERYLGYVVSVGIKLFVLYLIIGLGSALAGKFATLLTQAAGSGPPVAGAYLEIMSGALVFMILTWQVPSLAAAMMTGSPSLTLGTAAATTAMLTAAVASGVVKGMQQTTISGRQATNALASAAKLGQTGLSGISKELQSGASLSAAARSVAGGISRVASQQFKDSMIRGTGRESAAAAEKAAGNKAVQGWGRGTPLGNLTNRVQAHQDGASVETKPGESAPHSSNPRSINRITPPHIPHDHAEGNITIRF